MKQNYILEYLRFNLTYHIKRKFSFIKNKKINNLYILFFALKILLSSISIFSFFYVILSYISSNIEKIEYYYLLFLGLYIVLVPIIQRSKLLINPIDKYLLFKTKLTNFSIFNLIYITDVIKKIPSYINVLTIGLAISIFSNHPMITLLKILASFLMYIYLSYVFQIIYTNVKVNSMKKIFSFSYILINIFIGSIILVISYFFTYFVVTMFFNPFLNLIKTVVKSNNHFDWTSYLNKVQESIYNIDRNITFVLHYISPHNIFIDFNLFLAVEMSFIIFINFILFKNKLIGFWYRRSSFETFQENNWWIKKVKFNNFLNKIQLYNLLSNHEELNIHKPFIYISYSLWFFGGSLLYLSYYNNIYISNAFIIVWILNTVTRDSFTSGTDFFTKSLRFDSEGKSIALYRMANINFHYIYKAKLNICRLLGIKESLIIFILLLIFMKFDMYTIILSLEIFFVNFLIVPSLSLLPSYLSPHFNYQHYSELENFDEQQILEDSIFDKIKNGISISYFLIFFVGYIIQRNYVDIMIFSIVWNIVLLILTPLFIHFSVKKITHKWEKRDLYL